MPRVSVQSIVPTSFPGGEAFAAIKSDGSVVTWGCHHGGGDSSAVREQLSDGVESISATYMAFAALKSDGSVVTWGFPQFGGDSSAVREQLSNGVESIIATRRAFAATKSGGSVVTWGLPGDGGEPGAAVQQLPNGVESISATEKAFAAIKSDGTVVTWGDPEEGGDSSAVREQLSNGRVRSIIATSGAFAAIKSDGSVITWGLARADGGDAGVGGHFIQAEDVREQLLSNVLSITATGSAFAAIKSDGSVVTWGDRKYGGDSSAVRVQLSTGVESISATRYAFAAIKSGGSVVTWGSRQDGGGPDAAVREKLLNGVKSISAAGSAFAAIKSGGTVVTWGDPEQGGDSSAVREQLSNGGIEKVSGGPKAFVAIKSDGSVVMWPCRFLPCRFLQNDLRPKKFRPLALLKDWAAPVYVSPLDDIAKIRRDLQEGDAEERLDAIRKLGSADRDDLARNFGDYREVLLAQLFTDYNRFDHMNGERLPPIYGNGIGNGGSHSDFDVRKAAAEALGKNNYEVISALLDRLADGDWCVRRDVARSLKDVTEEGHTHSGEVITRVVNRLLVEDESWVRLELVHVLRDVAQRPLQKDEIAALLELQKDEIYAALQDDITAALQKNVIAARSNEDVIAALLDRVADKNFYVRWGVLDTLRKVAQKGNRKVIRAVLGRVVTDGDEIIRNIAVSALPDLVEDEGSIFASPEVVAALSEFRVLSQFHSESENGSVTYTKPDADSMNMKSLRALCEQLGAEDAEAVDGWMRRVRQWVDGCRRGG